MLATVIVDPSIGAPGWPVLPNVVRMIVVTLVAVGFVLFFRGYFENGP